MPPSTWITTPVTYEAFSEARKTHIVHRHPRLLGATEEAIGHDPPRAHNVDRDVVLTELGRQRFAEAGHARSYGVGEQEAVHRLLDRHRLDGEDAAPLVLAHERRDLADQPHHRQQRHFERAVPLLVGHLVQLAPWRAAAVRHEHVDSSERLLRARDDRFHVLGLRHVGRHREHLGAGLGPHLLGGVLDVALGTRAHRDACAFSREAQRARLAHALARRRDERDLTSQPQIHALLSPRVMSGARTSRSTDARHHQRTRVNGAPRAYPPSAQPELERSIIDAPRTHRSPPSVQPELERSIIDAPRTHRSPPSVQPELERSIIVGADDTRRSRRPGDAHRRRPRDRRRPSLRSHRSRRP